MTIKTFAPNGADTVQLEATTTSQRVAIDKNSSAVRVLNAGPNIAFIAFGDVTVNSTALRLPIPVGNTELFTKGANTHVAAICDTGTAVLYFTSGEGL